MTTKNILIHISIWNYHKRNTNNLLKSILEKKSTNNIYGNGENTSTTYVDACKTIFFADYIWTIQQLIKRIKQ